MVAMPWPILVAAVVDEVGLLADKADRASLRMVFTKCSLLKLLVVTIELLVVLLAVVLAQPTPQSGL